MIIPFLFFLETVVWRGIEGTTEVEQKRRGVRSEGEGYHEVFTGYHRPRRKVDFGYPWRSVIETCLGDDSLFLATSQIYLTNRVRFGGLIKWRRLGEAEEEHHHNIELL